MRLGLIGLGRIGAFHADTLSKLPVVDSLVVTDASPRRHAERSPNGSARRRADSPEALLASGVDGIVIAAATDAHTDADPGRRRRRRPGVLREAAVRRHRGGRRRRRATSNDSGVPVQIGYPRRFDPAFQAARDAVADGELGWVHTVRSTTLDPAPPPRGYIEVSGGIFRDCSVHDFDTVRWVTGREVVEVYATGSARGADFFAEPADVATAAAVLTLRRRRHLRWCPTPGTTPRGHDVRLELHGTGDSVAAGWSDRPRFATSNREPRWPAGPPAHFFMDRLAAAFRAELAAFTEVVAGQRPSPCTVDDAVAVCVDRRGRHPVPTTAPTGADRGGARS